MKKTFVWCAIGAAGLGLVLTGCGGAVGTATTDVAKAVELSDILRASETESREAGSARFSMTVDASGQEIGAEGVIAFGPDTQAMEAEYTGPGPDGTALSFVMRLVDGGMYLSAPGLFGSDQWLDLTGAGDMFGLGDLAERLEAAGDPTVGLHSLEPYADLVEEGTEMVDGEMTTRYRVQLDLEAIVDAPGALEGAFENLGQAEAVEMRLWVAEDQTVRKVEADMSVMDEDVAMTLRLFDWGTDVDVEAPPADQLLDPSDLGIPGLTG
ncbi:MAG: hypothetical protein ABWZ26_07230 [Candidatus Nanopelagicales bacterium]